MSGDKGILRESSRQYAQLRRKLSLSLALRWIIYTIAFLLVALVLNFTLVPWIADEVADSTSEWHELKYTDYPLERCLAILNFEYVGVARNIEDPITEESALTDAEVDELLAAGLAEDDIIEMLSVEEDWDVEGTDRQVIIDNKTGEQLLAIEEVPMDQLTPFSSIIVRAGSTDESSYATYTPRDLQVDAIHWELTSGMDYDSFVNWQIFDGMDAVMARDLTSYNFVKQFKYPVAICLYLIGCMVLIFLGYGRAMRYFAELSNAVGELIADKEKPIELSPALGITQDELNSIRLASLADERAAKYAERRKDELVAYLAHDIKTPLTSIMGYLMLLDEAPDMPQEQRQRFVSTAAEKAQRLETLMDEFFEITRYNLQAIPIERANVDVQLLLAQIADEFFPDAQAKGIEIVVEAPADEPIFVDGEKFARALGNIMRNAIAYADADSKVLLAAASDDERWTLTVENKGREISEAHLQSIFEKFYREDEARSSKSGGAGLGLAIAKEIVVAHGGTIVAESKNGTTIFTIAVPLS